MENNYSMKSYVADSAWEAYALLAKEINQNGEIVTARNEATKELLNVSIEILNPRDRIINIEKFNLPFILQETFDIINGNEPRVIHSKEMLAKTMGNSSDPMFFGAELRQALSRWSLKRIYDVFKKDKNTRKAVLSLGNRRPIKHTPCMIYSHFIIRDDKFYMTAETRGTALSMGFTNDVFVLTLIQEILFGWLKEIYPELQLGSFLYKTVSLHEYVDIDFEKSDNDKWVPIWNQAVMPNNYTLNLITLSYKEYLQDMGVLYNYIDDYMKAQPFEDIDNFKITTYDDLVCPAREYFNSAYFYNWALTLFCNAKSYELGDIDYIKTFMNGCPEFINNTSKITIKI